MYESYSYVTCLRRVHYPLVYRTAYGKARTSGRPDAFKTLPLGCVVVSLRAVAVWSFPHSVKALWGSRLTGERGSKVGATASRGTASRATPMDDNPEECPVCMTLFNEEEAEERPRNLPCGHTFCTSCINIVKKNDRISCPSCRTKHKVPPAGGFPISYTLEAVIRRRRDTGRRQSAVAQVTQRREKCLSRKMCALLREQEGRVQTTITACQEVQAQFNQYHTSLEGLQTQHQCLQDRLQAILDVVRDAREVLRQEKSHMEYRKHRVQQEENQLHGLLDPLSRVTTLEEACKMIIVTNQTTSQVEQGVEEWNKAFPSYDTVAATRKVWDASKMAVEAINGIMASLQPNGNESTTDEPACPITDRLNSLLTTTVTAEDVFSLEQSARYLLLGGLVVAVIQGQEDTCHARLSLKNNQLYLHSMQQLPVPLGAATLQMTEIVPCNPPCKVFLDIAWPGTAPQRVIIYLSPDTPRGRQFLSLCTVLREAAQQDDVRRVTVVDCGVVLECWGQDPAPPEPQQ
ncbi:hypothetical protein O3P69_019224 [Scylla paramamosain]|uniref:RING-type domain-containing protein n=1 Tax=Scylla paramamosain TaxID=85552 RepID=A0AAW0SWL4_SCYPA